MRLELLTDREDRAMSERLAAFSARFTYPLGADRRFRIDHPGPYLGHLASMGDPACLVALNGDRVIATLGLSARTLRIDGAVREAAYLCDLKIDPEVRGSSALLRVLRRAREWVAGRGLDAAFAVVMDGTERTPDRYSGRLGLPALVSLGQLSVLSIACPAFRDAPVGDDVSLEDALWSHESLSGGGVLPVTADRGARSEHRPEAFTLGGGSAVLEDTRRAKRLWVVDGPEMGAAHLVAISAAGANLGAVIAAGAARAAAAGFESLFVSLPIEWSPSTWCDQHATAVHRATATVYGWQLPEHRLWWVPSSEI